MDISSARPAVGTISTARSEPVQYREAVRTELPRNQRVSQPESASAPPATDDRASGDTAASYDRVVANRRARIERIADTMREALERRIEKDDAAGVLVYRTVDGETGEVIRQYPDDMILKLKAYVREMDRKQEMAAETNRQVQKVA